MESPQAGSSKDSSPVNPSAGAGASRGRLTRARKRKRISSESSSDTEPVLPENLLEVEKNLHASAVKNNLDDVSVKKILKTVVTNDHVLALVKLQEEESNMATESPDRPRPKITRAMAKELKKVSPRSAWNFENMELTPIKHIPVKTRPEVTALIDQELPEDEDDEEYEPTNDDVPSDDDHTLESCSDLDSQPRTPATPRSTASPMVLTDGPFKVPQDISTPRRKLDMNEDATIALRTRSKLSLSSIPIDHIESSFVPPDEPPMPATDDVWTDFLQVCLNPDTEAADDDDDPEYDVAADPDAHDEDEEGLENIMKISKKELNDLVTELFNVMPEGLGDELSGKLASDATVQNNEESQPSTGWECKQEPLSDEETPPTPSVPMPIPFVDSREKRLLKGKSEPLSDTEGQEESEKENRQNNTARPPKEVTLAVVEHELDACPPAVTGPAPPAPIQSLLAAKQTLTVQVEPGVKVLPVQIEILQQQLRQHIQLAASNYLQIFVHPVHWTYAPYYKEYLENLYKMTLENPKTVVNVCNLKPAVDLIRGWEKSLSADTEENKKMVEFVQKQVERSRRRAAQNNLYVGDFHQMYLDVVANSPVFLYPHLLPPIPYRSDDKKKFVYMRSEDELIALGLDEFWDYVEMNTDIYKVRAVKNTPGQRWGLITTLQLMCKHMFPWMSPKSILSHISHARKHPKLNEDNPINKFFTHREVTPVQHLLLPYNPGMTLYEQPPNEMPKVWIKHLAKRSQRFQEHLYQRITSFYRVGQTPTGVPAELGSAVRAPLKNPLPPHFCKGLAPTTTEQQVVFNVQVTQTDATAQMYSVVQTSTGAYLIPVTVVNTVDSAKAPISSSEVKPGANSSEPSVTVSVTMGKNPKLKTIMPKDADHCPCCVLLRKISRRQSLITEFFKTPKPSTCPCMDKRKVVYPKVTRKMRLLVNNYKSHYALAWSGLFNQMKSLKNDMTLGIKRPMTSMKYSLEEIATVTSFQLKLTIRCSISKIGVRTKKSLYTQISKFNPDADDIYTLMRQIEKTLSTEAEDVYQEFLGYLTMEQAEKMGRYNDYFRQECLTELMKKVEELVSNKEHKHNILVSTYTALSEGNLTSCEICTMILDECREYPPLADFVFSLFPHLKSPSPDDKRMPLPKLQLNVATTDITPQASTKLKNKTQKVNKKTQAKKNVNKCTRAQTREIKDRTKDTIKDNIEKNYAVASSVLNMESETDPLAIDNEAIENKQNHSDAQVKDNIEENNEDQGIDNADDEIDPLATDNPEDETLCKDSQNMDYEADHSDSDDDGPENLTIIEDPEEEDESQISIVKNEHTSENVTDTPQLPITKTEFQDFSESDMSMMIMSEDDASSIVKIEPPSWKREEDKLLLQILQQSLTPEEMKDKTILEIIEQKKVLQLAAQSLLEKTLDDVRERILYLLEFLVLS